MEQKQGLLSSGKEVSLDPVGVRNHERVFSRSFHEDHSAAAWRTGGGGGGRVPKAEKFLNIAVLEGRERRPGWKGDDGGGQ